MLSVKEYKIDSVFNLHIGKYAGKTIKEIIQLEPSYIDWYMINNFDFYISKETINKITQINPMFSLSEKGESVRKIKIESQLVYISKAYKLYFQKVSNNKTNEFADKINFYKQLQDDLNNFFSLTSDKYSFYEDILTKEIEIAHYINDRYQNYNFTNRDIIDKKKYNDDLDADQQSEEFWNQF